VTRAAEDACSQIQQLIQDERELAAAATET